MFFRKAQRLNPDDIKGKDEDKLNLALKRLEAVNQGVQETEGLIREYMREFRGQIRKG